MLSVVDLTLKFGFKDSKLTYLRSFEMNWQQSYKWLRFYAKWMRSMLVYDNPLSISIGFVASTLQSTNRLTHAY